MTKSTRFQPTTTSVADTISGAFSELEQIAEEMRSWYDNMPEGIQGSSRGDTVGESEVSNSEMYQVVDGDGVIHGAFETLEQARGCVEYDRLTDWSIWHNGERAEAGLREAHHLKYRPVLTREDMELIAEHLVKSADTLEADAKVVGMLLAAAKTDLLATAVRCRLLSRKLSAMLLVG